MIPSLHRNAVEMMAAGRDAEALSQLQQSLRALEGSHSPVALTHYIFGTALVHRLSARTAERCNLYLERFEVPQIRLFNLLAHAVPFVSWTTAIANQHLHDHLHRDGDRAPTVIDIGIGTGRQIEPLLRRLAAEERPIQALTVIGVEPSEWSLEVASKQVIAAGAAVGIDVNFVPVCAPAEELTAAQWRQIAESCTAPPVINASFALHHIADDENGADQRTAVLRQLCALQPRTLVLTEPDVDHHETDLLRRFDNCWAHFSTAFSVIDALDIAPDDRDALKASFFGREIRDILGAPEPLRSERHETTASWLRRLSAAGFTRQQTMTTPPTSAGPVRARPRPGGIALAHGDTPLVSLLASAPTLRKCA